MEVNNKKAVKTWVSQLTFGLRMFACQFSFSLVLAMSSNRFGWVGFVRVGDGHFLTEIPICPSALTTCRFKQIAGGVPTGLHCGLQLVFYGALYHLDEVGPPHTGGVRGYSPPTKRSDEEDHIMIMISIYGRVSKIGSQIKISL